MNLSDQTSVDPSKLSDALAEKLSGWRLSGECVEVRVCASTEAPGELFRRTWSGGERKGRAIKSLVMLWCVAAGSVLIPVAHFVLVPLFLTAGPVTALWQWRQKRSWLGGVGTCPECGAVSELLPSGESWPMMDVCKQCNAHVRIKLAE